MTIHILTLPPRIIPFSFGDSPIFAGQATQVTCLVSEGDLPLDITWSVEGFDDLSRLGISTIKGGKASMLLIDATSYKHRGNYTCTAKNPAGNVNYSTNLEIHGNPMEEVKCIFWLCNVYSKFYLAFQYFLIDLLSLWQLLKLCV